jgi:hypothetical protein
VSWPDEAGLEEESGFRIGGPTKVDRRTGRLCPVLLHVLHVAWELARVPGEGVLHVEM